MADLVMVNIDCDNAPELAAFYSALLGREIAYQDENVAMLGGEGVALGFGHVDDYTPPEWPNKSGSKAFHLDFRVADLDDAVAQSLALGATLPEFQPGGEGWRVLLDPAGHPFCLCPTKTEA